MTEPQIPDCVDNPPTQEIEAKLQRPLAVVLILLVNCAHFAERCRPERVQLFWSADLPFGQKVTDDPLLHVGPSYKEQRVAQVFEHQVSVRWRDTDALGHVNNAVYLTYLEEARDAFYLRALGDPIYVVVRIEIDFRAEVRHADRIVRVEIDVERVGTTSLRTREVLRTASGEVAAEARVITVRWDQDARAAVSFTDEQRARLAEFEA
ncbi:MAG TPA: thioesterase family protein [Streptosporangiaceae bacterium]|nr:thioesterase family protein [Streptosporangiaceae bacterium]